MCASELSYPAAFAGFMEKLLLLLIAFMFLLAPLAHPTLLAQGLESEKAIEAIVGSEVKTEEAAVGEESDRVVAAIENSLASAEAVRKAFSLDELDIIFLPEEGEAIEQAIAEHEDEIEALRESIEGSAMFYHAVDSRNILLRDIVAVEFNEDKTVSIFVRGSAE